MRRRAVLLSLLGFALAAMIVLPGAFSGSYAGFTDQEAISGNAQAGYWTAKITIEKTVATADEFTFVAAGVPGCDADKTLGNNQTFSCTYNALGGDDDYAISETVPGGWNNPGIVCEGTGSERVTPATPGISFDLDPQDNVTCTFTNTPQTGSLTIVKQVAGGDAVFDFETQGTGLSGFQIDTGADADDFVTFAGILTGEKTITELAETGWSFISVSCVDGSDAPIGTPSGAGVTFTLVNNDDVTCTFMNTKNATFTVDKDYSDDNTVNSVTVNVTGCTVAANGLPADEDTDAVFTVIDIPYPAGSVNCTATETNLPGGYTKNEAACASVAVAAGTTNATCTITNTRDTGTVVIQKTADAAGTFSFDLGTLPNCDDTSITLAGAGSDTITCTNVPTGTYNGVSETVPDGWTLDSVNCGAGVIGQPISVSVTKNATTTCVFTNSLNTASVTVDKIYSGANGGEVTVTLTCPNGSVTPASDGANDPTPDAEFTVTGFTSGTVCTVSEGTPPANYTPTYGDGAGDECNASGEVTLTPDASLSCTITNTQQATGTITIVKDARGFDGTEDIAGMFSFTSDLAGACTADDTPDAFILDDDSGTGTPSSETCTSVPNGTYVVTETEVAGWAIASISCTGNASVTYTGADGGTTAFESGDTTVNITINGTQSATCTFLNIQVPPACAAEGFTQPNPVTVLVPAGGALFQAGNQDQIIVGTSGDDWIVAGNSKDCIMGFAGDDVLIGGNGNDALLGGEGDDDLYGEQSPDRLDGGLGSDFCDLGPGGGDPAPVSCEAGTANRPGTYPPP